MKQQFLMGKASTIRITVYSVNTAVIPTSGTITLYEPSGGVLEASTAVTVDGTTGEMTYALTATHTATKNLNYKASWSYVVSGETFYEDTLFDVVLNILSIPINDSDIVNELDSLRESSIQSTSTATSATTSTLLDTVQRKEVDNFWKGGTISIISGTGADQERAITGSTQSTGTITISPNWATTPDSTSVYLIIRSYDKKITQAFRAIETMLYNMGRRHSLILESSQIEIPLLYLTISNICLDLHTTEGDKYWNLYVEYKAMFDKAFDSMKVEYDADESGTNDGDETATGINTFRLERA